MEPVQQLRLVNWQHQESLGGTFYESLDGNNIINNKIKFRTTYLFQKKKKTCENFQLALS